MTIVINVVLAECILCYFLYFLQLMLELLFILFILIGIYKKDVLHTDLPIQTTIY